MENGLGSDHQAETTWREKGVTAVVKCSGKRFGCNAITAITNYFRDGKAKDKQDMGSKTRAFLKNKQRRLEKVRKYFEGPKVAYAAAA